MASPVNVSYPTIAGIGPAVPSFAGGPPIAVAVVSARVVSEDTIIPGALVIDPRQAGAYYAGKRGAQYPVPGDQEPLQIASRAISERQATAANPNAWKRRPAVKMSDAVMFGRGKPQAPFAYPWNKKFIPPLALFNDASQWVNKLLLHAPMTWYGANGIGLRPPAKSNWFSPPPKNTTNLAAGQLNLQLQLGQMMIQQQQLQLTAANFMSA